MTARSKLRGQKGNSASAFCPCAQSRASWWRRLASGIIGKHRSEALTSRRSRYPVCPRQGPKAACGFRTQSCRSQSYPLANLQLKPLRTSTSRLDHSESSENRCLLSESILDIRNIFDWLFQRVATRCETQSKMLRK